MVKKKLVAYEFPAGEEPKQLTTLREEIAVEKAKQELEALKSNMTPDFIASLQIELARRKLELDNWDALLDQDWDACVGELETREQVVKRREEAVKAREALLQKSEDDLRTEFKTWAATQQQDMQAVGKVLDKMAEYIRKQGVGSKRVLYDHLSAVSRIITGMEYKWNEGSEQYTKVPAKYTAHELDRVKLIASISGKG